MKLRHRNPAIIGVTVWIGMLVGWILLLIFKRHREGEAPRMEGDTVVALFWITLIVQAASFFWGGHHLAKGKGYSNAIVALGLVPCFQPVLLTVLLTLPDKFPSPSRRAPKRTHHPHESGVARKVRYRRNALVGVVPGVLAIVLAISVVLFPRGVSMDNEFAVAILIFVIGYACVIFGCSYWLKAKGWNEAILSIAMFPLIPLFIPFVRLVVLANLSLLILAMVMAPLILVVVVLALPDKNRL